MSARVLHFVWHGLWVSGTALWMVTVALLLRDRYAFQRNYNAQFRYVVVQTSTIWHCVRVHTNSQARKLDRIAWLLGLMCAHDWGLCSLTFFPLMFHGLTSLFLSLGPKLILCAYVCEFFCLFISHIIRFFYVVLPSLTDFTNCKQVQWEFSYVSSWRLLAVVWRWPTVIIFFPLLHAVNLWKYKF